MPKLVSIFQVRLVIYRYSLQPWVQRFVFQCKYPEYALMHFPKRLPVYKVFKAFNAKCKLAQGQAAFGFQVAGFQAANMLRPGILGAIN